MRNDLAGMSIHAGNLEVGTSRDLDERLAVTRMSDDQYVVKEKGGDTMWLFDASDLRFTQVVDTDKNGTYDSLVDVWGDPHFYTQSGLADITDEASLAEHMAALGNRTRYDVQTDYTLIGGSSEVTMKTVTSEPGFTVNDEGSINFLSNNNLVKSFSFDFVNGDVAFKTGATNVLAGSSAPVTNLAVNADVDDYLYLVGNDGRWAQLAEGTHIDTKGEVVQGDLHETYGRNKFTAEARFKSIEEKSIDAAALAYFTLRLKYKEEDDEDEDDPDAMAISQSRAFVNNIAQVSELAAGKVSASSEVRSPT